MPKGQKSSATSATRKKHARKAAGDAKQELPLPKEKKKEKGKNKKEPRVKVFIAPTKPAPIRPDPLDSLGIAKRLHPDLLVILRRLAKKDSVTKRKALEEFQSDWVERALRDSDDEGGIVESMLQTALPVWLHHLPSLLLSASRRIRLLAATIHTSLLRIQSIHEQVMYFLNESGDAAQVEGVLGSWSMASEDVDRSIAIQARKGWDLVFSGVEMDNTSLSLLLPFAKRALFDPIALYMDLNPVQPTFAPQLPAHASPRNKAAAKRPPIQPAVDEDSLPRKQDEEEESESDRKGRLRVGALGVLRWILEKEKVSIQDQLSELLASPLFWTGLYYGPSPPFCSIHSSSGFVGDEQPIVRKTAWGVLRNLLRFHNAYVQNTLLHVLSSAVLRSAWVEPDSNVRASIWEPLLKFLTQYPTCWDIDLASVASKEDEDEEGSEEESDHDDTLENDDGIARVLVPSSTQSEAFREFLTFLSLGCYGSSAQGYPTVVIILSTIPPSMIGREPETWTDFVTSFWAALDGRAFTSIAVERAAGSAAFLSALIECVILLVKRSRAFSEGTFGDDRRHGVAAFVRQQFDRVWEELVKDRLRMQGTAAGKVLARAFAALESLNESLFAAAWEPMALSITSSCSPQQTETASVNSKRFSIQISLLKGLWEESQDAKEATWTKAISTLICTTASVLIEQTGEQLESVRKCRLRPADVTAPQRLAELLSHFSSLIFGNCDLSSRIDTLMHRNIMSILRSEPAMQLCLVFLSRRGDDTACLSLWRNILKTISSDLNLQEEVLPLLVSAAEKGDLSSRLRPEDGEMDSVAIGLVADVLDVESGRDTEFRRTLLKRLLGTPHFFLSPRTASSLLHRIANAFSESSRVLMHDSSSPGSLASLRSPLVLLSSVIEARPDVALSPDIRGSLPDLFVFGHALPRTELLSSEAKALCLQARQMWSTALSEDQMDSEQRDDLLSSVRSLLRDLIVDVHSRVSPEAVLQIIAEGHAGTSIDLLQDLFPSQEVLEDRLRDLPSNPIDAALAIVDPLIPPPSLWHDDTIEHSDQPSDRTGMFEYSRIVNALLVAATDNRDLVRQNIWLLRHFLILTLAASERQMVPSAISGYFSHDVAPDVLQEIATRAKALTAFLLSETYDEEWHTEIVRTFVTGKDRLAWNRDPFSFVVDLLKLATKDNGLRESRVLYMVLRHLLNGAVTSGAEQWMTLARRIEKQASRATLVIIRAVNESGLEPPSLDHYRNAVAAEMLGVPASRADTDGLALLHRLALAAPDADSDTIFLPQNRAVRLMKTCQGWVESDEGVSEDVESEMTLVFQYLAPILQNVPGAHWDFIFDVTENNLENCSFTEPSTLVALSRTLKLVLIVQDLCRTNKSLRAVWTEREKPILTLVRDVVQNASGKPLSASVPRSVCWNTALTIVQNLPDSLIDHESLPKMAHLILDPSSEVAKMSYSLLFKAAQKWTEYLVVEAGVDTSSETAKYEIPVELVRVLESALQPDDSTEPVSRNIFAYLLGWTIVFDLFDNASLRVKMSYATQLRDLDLIGSSFLPFIFDLLELYGGRSRPFPLEAWSVEEYYVQFYDPDSLLSPRLFAAHLFYRALLNVPSLIANWWAACKDRQLLTSVTNLTTKYYSPVLIAAELRHIKDPEGVAELSGENWSIKVAAGIGEVSAAYTVDEQVMEIAVRLPPDYPLHGIEVRDVQKLGVDEKRWRGWLLAVQQIVSSQNGRIVDGLSMFKKNVTHHFENQTECAICYSIISVTELALPKKRCKTCKNKFHSGCLFKWFNTSHTSSCPLCRSDFI
ncbi:hypothetical protein ACEPAF_2324 [Sanghuangporus sanghuang]